MSRQDLSYRRSGYNLVSCSEKKHQEKGGAIFAGKSCKYATRCAGKDVQLQTVLCIHISFRKTLRVDPSLL